MAYALITPNGIKFVATDNENDHWFECREGKRLWKPGKRMGPLLEGLYETTGGGYWLIRRESASIAEIVSKPILEWYLEE